MRILLALDTAATAEMLLNAVAARQWPGGTEARVVSIVEDETIPQEVWREAGFRAEAVRQEMRRRGEQLSALAVEPLRWLGIEAEVAVLRGDPQWLIPLEARRWGADLILIRAHNRTDFRSWMLGSVAKSVTRNAPCSVEVVRAPRRRRRPPAEVGGRTRVLLATDGSAHSAEAVRAVAARPWPEGTDVKVMSMVNPVAYSLEELGLYRGGSTERAHRAIDDAARVLTGAGLQVTAEVVAGRPAKRIIAAAEEMRADLIVVGTEDRRGLRRLLSGSVSEAVANGAHCSVSVARSPSRVRAGGGALVLAS
ncbi:MAG TPA: universal stress protein [Pyrinomonadaceae bacterium]|nr:universal stress protein [Pyrinomonadaceae bacterium]